jgi:hypothetical protein
MKSRFLALFALGVPAMAFATLGGDISSVQGDRSQMRAKTTSVTGSVDNSYTVHTMQTEAGTTVREYADAAGKVFAVTWEGPVKPDLSQLLGQYFSDFREEAASGRVGRRRLKVDKPNVVILSEGRMRALAGKAYLPQAVPAGVKIEDLE